MQIVKLANRSKMHLMSNFIEIDQYKTEAKMTNILISPLHSSNSTCMKTRKKTIIMIT